MTSIPKTHEAIGHASASSGVVALQVPTELPGSDEVLVRVLYTVVGPADLWHNDYNLLDFSYPSVFGLVLAGEVVKAGEGTDFKSGEKIISFSVDVTNVKGKTFQEYATLSKWSISRAPKNLTLQEAVTVPDSIVTVFHTVFTDLGLPVPTEYPSTITPLEASTPILVWGAAGSVGQYALQVLKLAGYKNIFAVASTRHHEFLRTLGATSTFDYTKPGVTEQIEKAAGGKLRYVFDTIGDEEHSLRPITKVVGEGSKVAYLLPVRTGGHGSVSGVSNDLTLPFPDGVEKIGVRTLMYQENEHFKKELQPLIIPKLLEEGLIKPSKVREIQGATLLERVTEGFSALRKGVSGERIVIKVSDA